MAKSRRPDVVWQAIEADYRASILSIRTIAKLHSVSHQAINKHAKKTTGNAASQPASVNAQMRS